MIVKLKYTGFVCLVLAAIFTFNGCHLAQKSVSGRTTMLQDENKVRKVIHSQPEWTFMEIRMTGKAAEDKSKLSFIGTIKLDKDKQIFVLLRSSIGFEVARLYANRDSVWVTSKILNIREKGEWKIMASKIGYPLDFNVIQGIFTQSLFTATGDQPGNLVNDLVVKEDKENYHLVSATDLNPKENGIKYLNDFKINPDTFIIENVKIHDINGQWIAEVQYQYNKDNLIRKIEVKGMDTQRNFSVDINVVKRDIPDNIEINFDKF